MQKIALVVDDSRVARMTLKKVLQAQQFEVVELENAEQAMNYLAVNDKPFVIFMDVMMGGMDGHTATRQIKADALYQSIPVVICTGNDRDSSKAIENGADAVLIKPPQAEDIVAIVAGFEQPIAAEPVVHDKPVVTPATINKPELTEKVLATLESKLLPKVQQSMSDIAEKVSYKVASQLLEKARSEDRAHGSDDALLPLQQQLMSLSTRLSEQLDQQAIEQLIEQHVSAALPVNFAAYLDQQQVEQLVDDKVMALLAGQQALWQRQLPEQISTLVDEQLTQSLATMTAPLVSLQVEKALQQDQTVQQLTNKVAQLGRIVAGLAVALVVAIVVVVIL